MLTDLKFECRELLEEYEGVTVLGVKGLGITGPFLTQIETPGGSVRVYHEQREGFATMVGVEILPHAKRPKFLRTFRLPTDEDVLNPMYAVFEAPFPTPLGEFFGYRSDLALAEKLGIPDLKGKHEGMVSSSIVSRIRRELAF